LASAGARVLVAVRDPARAEPVIAQLREQTGSPTIELVPLDLASQASVRGLADAFEGPLHILIANAGVMAAPKSSTKDGYELQFGTNHLGHFTLVTGLLDNLRAAGAPRVVVVSSAGHRRSDVDFDDPHFEHRPYDPWTAYGQSKTANILFGVELFNRFAADGMTANALHPGGIMTNLQRYVGEDERRRLGWFDEQGNPNPAFKTPEQGASTSIWAAVAPELEGVGGQYLEDCHIAEVWSGEPGAGGYAPYARDPEHAARLWDLSVKTVG
jgi:NAD(P)-dependent dehydrogenase (short-subunit alcohol dehydrogenase family)